MCNPTHTCSQVFVHAPTHMEFIGHVQWLETLSRLIKQQHGKHKYIMIIHYYSYLVKWNWHTLKHNALALTESPSRAHTHVDCVCKLGWICNTTHVLTGFCVRAPTNIKFIVCIRQLKACFCLIKQQQGMHKYTKIFNIIMHYYTYLIIQSKVKLTPTEKQQPCTQSHLQARAHMHVCIHPPPPPHTHRRIASADSTAVPVWQSQPLQLPALASVSPSFPLLPDKVMHGHGPAFPSNQKNKWQLLPVHAVSMLALL